MNIDNVNFRMNYTIQELPSLKEIVKLKSVFLIEKGWIDPMENSNADGYEPFGYKITEEEAKEYCESRGYWTADDCWSIKYKPNGIMPKYRYNEIKYLYD